MLKGQGFKEQIFENQIFALFVNTFLNGTNGVSSNYKEEMAISHTNNTVTVYSGAVCIQGRFLEEESYNTEVTGTDEAYCKLVIEIDLDKVNTASNFNQGTYKIIKSTSGYPNLTQDNIVKNNAGVYQYELARFRTSVNGITNFQDRRTFLDFASIYSKITNDYETVLSQLQNELEGVKTQEGVALRSDFATVEATLSTPLSPHSGVAIISYPTGFNKNNTAVVSAVPKSNNNYNFNAINKIQYVQLNDDNIYINYLDPESDVTGKVIEISIMKK